MTVGTEMNTAMVAENDRAVLKIVYDENALNPREDYEHLGTMICFHPRYTLGDHHDYTSPQEFLRDLALELMTHHDGDSDEVCDATPERWLEIIEKHTIILPVYMYEHSGVALSTAPYSCPWDSGQVGWIYATYKQIKRWYNDEVPEKAQLEQALAAEVKEMSAYLNGENYGFELYEKCDGCGHEGVLIDSCYGFTGDLSEAIEAMKDHVAPEYDELFDSLR